MKNSWYFLLFSGLTMACLILFNSRIQTIPPLGKFFDPFHGFWQNAEQRQATDIELQSSRLHSTVKITIDQQGVPHIFANNEEDLYFAQGYITAKDRLWQMDFQTRFAAGRLSEVVGKEALELDRYQRRTGMIYGAEAMLRESMQDPKSKMMMECYAAGINAYIERLRPQDYPIEFKILDYAPEKWQTLNSALLLKLMSATLARGTNELALTNILKHFGPEVTEDLFPDDAPRRDPIIPAGTPWDFTTPARGGKSSISSPGIVAQDEPAGGQVSERPRAPDVQLAASKPSPKAAPLSYINRFLHKNAFLTAIKPENIGSNNWAVDGSKTQTGYPVLANDPHLDLTLPAIWYQIQLHGPGINVYGVSIPGAPNVIIGFNRHVAWGVTNVGSDVLDWFKIQFRDSTRREYFHNGTWQKTTFRMEEIKVKGAETITDTVYYTHHGPVSYPAGTKPSDFSMVNNIPEDHALNWVAHLPSNELRTFYELNKAQNHDDYRRALSHYTAPAQNFAFADNSGTIAITSNGLLPMKEHQQGKFLLDGSRQENEWSQRIPFSHNPTAKNPSRAYVSSANQWPVGTDYPYYLGWEFAAYERAHRINELLDTASNQTAADFIGMQNDNYSVLAEELLPVLLESISAAKELSSTESAALKTLNAWNYRYDAHETAATIFESWYTTLRQKIWSDEFSGGDALMRFPGRERTVSLITEEAESPWYAIAGKSYNRAQLVLLSFRESIAALSKQHGDIANWQWAKVRKAHVPHLADIPGFGSPTFQVGGVGHAINAMSESNGPSWRMVVQLGEKPEGHGIIPGGQSGNPGSRFYDDQLIIWKSGKLSQLLFLESPDELPDQTIQTIIIKSAP